MGIHHGSLSYFRAAHSCLDYTIADITVHLGSDFYSGGIFFNSTPFPSWGDIITNEQWKKETDEKYSNANPSDNLLLLKEVAEELTYKPKDAHRRTAWFEGMIAHDVVDKPSPDRLPEEGRRVEERLKAFADKVSILVIFGEESRFFVPEEVKRLCKETFPLAEVQIWPKVRHVPFLEEPEKTRNEILEFVERVCNAQHGSEPPSSGVDSSLGATNLSLSALA